MGVVLVVLATFIAAAVEWVEALTIVLAVGLFKGWRSAFAGTIAGLLVLSLITVAFGVAITSHVDIALVRTVVGVFLLLFGLKWLHKAILRSSGLKALHDEAKAFEATKQLLAATGGPPSTGIDKVGFTTALSGVFLEGLEVVFIVIALGGLHSVPAATIGAGASLVVVIAAGIVFRAPLTRVPENTMKYVVGILLTSFGTFFAGEGIGVAWWHDDVVLLPLIAVYGAGSLAAVWVLRHPGAVTVEVRFLRSVRAALSEVWGLFVDEGALAIATIAVLLGAAVFVDHFSSQRGVAAVLLVIGVFVAVAISLSGAIKQSWSRTSVSETVAEVEAVLANGVVTDGPLETSALRPGPRTK
jgi:Ca2+/H+ antiporter, TMEM165/GDT1 family